MELRLEITEITVVVHGAQVGPGEGQVGVELGGERHQLLLLYGGPYQDAPE